MHLHPRWTGTAAIWFVTWTAGPAAAGPAMLSGPMPQPRMVLTGSEAFAMLPAELVAAPVVTRVLISDAGRYLLAQRTHVRVTADLIRGPGAGREPPPGEVSLVLWDTREREGREVWKAPLAGTSVSQIEWLSRSNVALALIRQMQGAESRQALLRISGGAELVQVLPLVDAGGAAIYSLHVSPTQSLAILQQTAEVSRVQTRPDGSSREVVEPRETFTLLGRDGRPGRRFTLPAEQRLRSLAWDESGNAILTLFRVGPGPGEIKDQPYSLDSQTGALRPLAKAPALSPSVQHADGDGSPTLPLRVVLAPSPARDGEQAERVGLLWLEGAVKSEKPRALVCGDSTGGQLLPAGDGVLYFSQGAVWVAPLLRLTHAEYQASVDRARQAETMSRAKQIGLGLIMYAQDYDGAFPAAEEMRSRLAPYLKDENLADGFVFTYLGGKETNIQNPAETELGYITTAGGRAVLYADGHVALKKE
jgi:prepilin-type processing-associated H-X9-DG protein